MIAGRGVRKILKCPELILEGWEEKMKNPTKDWLNKSTPLPLLAWSDRNEAKTAIIAAQKRSLP